MCDMGWFGVFFVFVFWVGFLFLVVCWLVVASGFVLESLVLSCEAAGFLPSLFPLSR